MNVHKITSNLILIVISIATIHSSYAEDPILYSEKVNRVDYDSAVFQDDPATDQTSYHAKNALDNYQNKSELYNPRPLLELGYNQYASGLFPESSLIFGKKNPSTQQFLAYGDWLTTAAYNDNTPATSRIATRLNLDFDWKITGTERIHLFLRPLDKDGKITQIEKIDSADTNSSIEANAVPDALFFEGDMGAIVSGITNSYTSWDLPFAAGLMPMIFQNGIWLSDAFTGFAFTLPARHSTYFDISNYDVTFFAGFDKVSSIINAGGKESDVNLYGVTTFIEANKGYWELGYGFTQDTSFAADQSYHNVTVAFTRRYGAWLSNSFRLISNFGQSRKNNLAKTADGVLILVENSFITSKPSTLIPYVNMFAGIGIPQSLARAAGAGGVLQNTGINFESPGLSGNSALNATANDTIGGAIGVEYLFSLNQQLILELATVIDSDTTAAATNLATNQYALAIRYQLPVNNAWIIRFDSNLINESVTNSTQYSASVEIRRKF